MFGFNQGSEVVYQCSTRLTAGSGIGVGVFIALVFAWILGRDWLLMDKGNLWGIAAFMLVGVLIALRGVYLYCRPRVETRHIVVGNLTHRLYLRNKPLFVLFTGGVYALVVVGVTLVFDLIEWAVEGFDDRVGGGRLRCRRMGRPLPPAQPDDCGAGLCGRCAEVLPGLLLLQPLAEEQ